MSVHSSVELRLARAVTGFAAAVSLVLAVVLPVGSYWAARMCETSEAQAEARIAAVAVSELVVRNPDHWRFETVRIAALLAASSHGGGHSSAAALRRVRDHRGAVAAELAAEVPAPTLKVREPVYDAGRVVGEVEIVRSLRGVVTQTGWVAAAAAALSFLAFFALRLLPLRMLRRAEEELRGANRALSALIDASPVAIVAVDPELKVLTWNPAAEQVFGYTAAEMVGRPYALLVPEAERESYDQLCGRLLDGEVVRGARMRRRRKDGVLRDVTASGAALFGPDGAPRGIVVALEDVTERQAVEEQLRQSQKMEAVGQLTGGLAHDFNNLLGVIVGNLDLLRERLSATDPEAAEILGEALGAALRGAELNRRLLAFSRRQPLRPRQLDVNALVRDAAGLLARALGEAVEVRLSLAPDLAPVVADPAQLEASLTNLAVNARDAMPRGGQLTIATRNAALDAGCAAAQAEMPPGDYVLLEVTDTGAGMPAEVLARAFEPFFTTKEAGKGTGLGLSMVYGFAKQSGGHVRIYSEVGHGTTVRLYLPRAVAKASEAETAAAEAPPPPRGRERVLVVEDQEALRRVLLRQLAELGYEALEAEDARAALALLDRGAPVDLLLTDVVMPGGMNGRELACEAQRRRPGLKTLFTSGFPDVGCGRSGDIPLPEGALLLGKPYRKEELARTLRDVLAV